MKTKKILIDPGHSGMSVEKGYTTPGKRSPKGNDGIIYEGASNRAFAFNLCYRLSLLGIPVEVVNADTRDISLSQRVINVNNIVSAAPSDYLLISVHSNAVANPPAFVSATGMEIFTSVNAPENTTTIASTIATSLIADLPMVVWRRGDKNALFKRRNFNILLTKCPAVLLEILFMDGVSDYGLLTSPEFRVKVETAIVKALAKIAKP